MVPSSLLLRTAESQDQQSSVCWLALSRWVRGERRKEAGQQIRDFVNWSISRARADALETEGIPNSIRARVNIAGFDLEGSGCDREDGEEWPQ